MILARTNYLSPFCILTLLLVCAGCSDKRVRQQLPAPAVSASSPGSTSAKLSAHMPWELLPFARDAQGNELTRGMIRTAEELVRQGDRVKAVALYRSAMLEPLSPLEREAVVFKLASCELALDQADTALTTLSSYFRTLGGNVEQISARFSLLFGYAYGRRSDFDQAAAWFNRAYQNAGQGNALQDSASVGLKALVAALPAEDFERFAARWRGEDFVAVSVAHERGRRAGANLGTAREKPFSEFFSATGPALTSSIAAVPHGGLGVILPMSGPHAALGNHLKNGLELALEGVRSEWVGAPDLAFRDSAGEQQRARLAVEEFIATRTTRAILGPLLADEVTAVQEFGARGVIPLLTFSKRSDFESTGSLFRLAATTDLQIRSLLNRLRAELPSARLAVIYPDDLAGIDYAERFRRQSTAAGFQILYESSFPLDDAEALIQRAKEVEAQAIDALFFAGNLESGVRFFSSMSERKRKRVRPLALAHWYNPQILANSATVLNRAWIVSPFFAASQREVVAKFIALYRERYKEAPDFLAAQGFDAGTIALAAVRRELEEGMSFADALRAIGSYEGLMGSMRVNERGEIEIDFPVVELNAGELQEAGQMLRLPGPGERKTKE